MTLIGRQKSSQGTSLLASNGIALIGRQIKFSQYSFVGKQCYAPQNSNRDTMSTPPLNTVSNNSSIGWERNSKLSKNTNVSIIEDKVRSGIHHGCQAISCPLIRITVLVQLNLA